MLYQELVAIFDEFQAFFDLFGAKSGAKASQWPRERL
jgi:hypothetical protein